MLEKIKDQWKEEKKTIHINKCFHEEKGLNGYMVYFDVNDIYYLIFFYENEDFRKNILKNKTFTSFEKGHEDLEVTYFMREFMVNVVEFLKEEIDSIPIQEDYLNYSYDWGYYFDYEDILEKIKLKNNIYSF